MRPTKARTDLRPWLQARLGAKIERHGPEWGLPCPECDVGRAKEFRLWFNIEKNTGTCYKCHRAFNTLSLVQVLEGVSFTEALRLVKEHTVSGVLSLALLKQRVEQAFSEVAEAEPEKLGTIALPDEFLSCADHHPSEWPAYILKRIGSLKTVYDHGIGWCVHGYFKYRMVVPIRLDGEVVSFIARDMTGTADKKVLYPKGCKTSRMLFNYDRARRFDRVILVEGVLDALRTGPRCMAILGTNLSDSQVTLLANSEAREVVVMLDGDAAGEAGALKVVERLRSMFKLRVVRLPRGLDPDDFSRPELLARVDAAPRVGREDFRARVRRALGR